VNDAHAERKAEVLSGGVKIAMGSRLKGIPNVLTLGIRPNPDDYSPEEWDLIRCAPILYYPTLHFVHAFAAMGKTLFPRAESYAYIGDKIRQTVLFKALGIPHPRTRFYYARHVQDVLHDFRFPFVAKIPRSSDSGRGVYLVRDRADLSAYLQLTTVAYVQEYLEEFEDYRAVIIGPRIALIYRRRTAPGSFKCNLAQGGAPEFGNVPRCVEDLALRTARVCGFDDVGIDILRRGDEVYVLEANFRYGRKGFRAAGLDYKRILQDLLERGEI